MCVGGGEGVGGELDNEFCRLKRKRSDSNYQAVNYLCLRWTNKIMDYRWFYEPLKGNSV